MKIIFMGTPLFAVPILEKLIEAHEVLMVVTQPDKKVGRKQELIASPVKTYALAHQIKVFQPEKLKDSYHELLNLGADLIVTAAYGQMLPKALLDHIKAINVHGSLLPSYRGGAPIQYALFDALEETGITIMYMAFKMDSGNIIKQSSLKILETDNYETLAKRLSILGSTLLIDVLNEIEANHIVSIKQDEALVSYAYVIKREEEFLDFNKETKYVLGKIRGLSPDIGASFIVNDLVIKVYQAEKSDIIDMQGPGYIHLTKKTMMIETKEGVISLLEIQLPGKKRMAMSAFLNGQGLIKNGDIAK